MAPRCNKLFTLILVALGCTVAFLFRSGPVIAQSPNAVSSKPIVSAEPLAFDRGAAALWQSLLKLHTRASLLMVTAHPDDEDGGMLTYESRGQGARTALMTLNRGEGGANVMSSDYFDALGLVRTEELLAADRYYGVQQFFSRMCDYGFSKTKEEALEKWGHDQTLVRRSPRRSHDSPAGHHFRLCRRAHGRPRQSSGRRADGAGSLRSRRRSSHVSRADQGRTAALEAAQGLCARAVFPRHRQGDFGLCGRQVLPRRI